MRIISGHLRSRKIDAVPGTATRPTADRTRESLFNILGAAPRGSHVLDLYAGTGALGIEALSRGARCAVFVENAPRALAVLEANLRRLNLLEYSRILKYSVSPNMDYLRPLTNTFDLVFIDPPYNRQMVRPTLEHLDKSGVLRSSAVIVVEHAPAENIEKVIGGLRTFDQRRYGAAQLTFLRPNAPAGAYDEIA